MQNSDEVSQTWGGEPPALEGYREPSTYSTTGARVITLLRQVNYWRYRRLCSDFAWMQKQVKKMGLNPEDARLYVGYRSIDEWRCRKDGQ